MERLGEWISVEESVLANKLDERVQWSGNFRGWKQLRKFLPHEDDFSKVANR
jgi:hypothetical protein